MPERKLELAPDSQLFPDDDPLTLSVPDEGGKYRKFLCKDRVGLKQVDPSERQLTWFIEELTHQVVDEEQREFRAMLTEAVETGRIPMQQPDGRNPLAAMFNWVVETREKAEKGELARVTRRPTKAQQRSSPS